MARRQPDAISRLASREKVTGSHERYATISVARRATASITSRRAPARGGSRKTKSARGIPRTQRSTGACTHRARGALILVAVTAFVYFWLRGMLEMQLLVGGAGLTC